MNKPTTRQLNQIKKIEEELGINLNIESEFEAYQVIEGYRKANKKNHSRHVGSETVSHGKESNTLQNNVASENGNQTETLYGDILPQNKYTQEERDSFPDY